MNARKYSYRQMLLIYLGAVVGVFVLVAAIWEIRVENSYKKSILATRMEGYADIVNEGINFYNPQSPEQTKESGDGLFNLIPDDQEVRLTILQEDADVIYDSDTRELSQNHGNRPEIVQCLEDGSGWAIRLSETNGREYCYFAKKYEKCLVRIAIPYELDVKDFLHTNTPLLIYGIILLLIVVVAIGRAMLKNYKNLEEALKKVENEKSENKRMKREMTHNIAHELRTPVSSMRGYLEALTDYEDLDEERKKLFIQRAYLQSLRLSDLLRDISLVTKIEEAPEMIKVEEVNLREIVCDVCDEFAAKMSSLEIQAVNLIDEGLKITGSPSLVYAIFRNLVENSCKYAGKGANIVVRAEKTEDGYIRVLYKDSGKGVDKAMLERIFERFFRLDNQTSSDYRDNVGSGLGLSVVRNAVQFHGGQISAQIPAEGGLEFDFTLKN